MRTLSAGLMLILAMSVGPIDSACSQETLVVKIQDLQLTEAQETKIADIRKECRPKIQESAKELATIVREEFEKIGAALTPEQKQKVQTLREEREDRREECLAHTIASLKELDLTDAEMAKIADIRKEFRPRIVQVTRELEGFLSEAQKKARAEAVNAGKSRREVLQAIGLTDEQKQKLMTVGKDLGGVVREEMERIRDVLSEGQKEQLQELRQERKEQVRDRMAHRIANLRELNLTDEQQTKIANIRQEFRPKVQEAGNKLRAAIRDEVEKIVAVIKG